ncbi:hypothetical protein GGR50DRAFT_627781 [Xylaria sp. CBS 124048]|nr:hypothetical protein GGR50DRAFT_627781 [Xylaria sp. CBS 124048]
MVSRKKRSIHEPRHRQPDESELWCQITRCRPLGVKHIKKHSIAVIDRIMVCLLVCQCSPGRCSRPSESRVITHLHTYTPTHYALGAFPVFLLTTSMSSKYFWVWCEQRTLEWPSLDNKPSPAVPGLPWPWWQQGDLENTVAYFDSTLRVCTGALPTLATPMDVIVRAYLYLRHLPTATSVLGPSIRTSQSIQHCPFCPFSPFSPFCQFGLPSYRGVF